MSSASTWPREYKAWTQGNADPDSVAAELCAFAVAWGPDEWAAHPAMLSNTAQWVAEEAAAFGIPLVALTAEQAQTGAAGVCQHADLGASGGGHWDCGPHFPMGQVIEMAAIGGISVGGGAVEICSTPSGNGYWICGSDGGVFTYGDAEFHGSLGDTDLAAPIVGITNSTGRGYWLLGQDGGVFTFGDARFYGAATGVVS